MMHQVMFQCGDFLISGIVAAGAGTGFVGVPALFRTGGGLRYVTHQIMVQCRQLFAGGIAAADAAVVSVPANFRTGGGFCFVLHQIMVQCGQLFAGGIAAADAAVVSVPALFRAGGGFCFVLHQIVVIGVFFAVFPTTHLTDRFGGAGCFATGTLCSINFAAVVRAAAGVRAVAGG